MNRVPQTYSKYDLLFTPRLIPFLKTERGETWQALIERLCALPETSPDVLAFSLMMIELNSCLTCEMDSYRAQRGCLACAKQTVVSFKGSDAELICRFESAKANIEQKLDAVAHLIQNHTS